MLQKLLCSIFILLSTVFISTPASALESGDVVMSITPSNQDIELYPGQTYHGSVAVSNVGRLPFEVKASVSRYYAADDSYTPDFSAGNAYTKLHNWVTLPKDQFHLEPGQTTTVEFEVSVPKDVPGGGQYAAIMLLSDGGDPGNGAMKVTGQLAAILYGHVNGGEIRTEGSMTEHTFPRFVMDKPFAVSQTIANTGNTDFKVTQKLTVRSFFSNRELLSPNSLSESGQPLGYSIATVLPDTSRASILTWEDTPKFGLFQVTQEISFLDQTHTFTHLVFVCPSWLFIIVIALIIVLIVWLIIHIRRRRLPKDPVI